ncbi:hypothetical protein FPANT_3895 [Fusarium pseudoanthophilum]|uniref:Uncharacterized protein n=1 Tax=Fusarium pseudoanthophilum TaxID=48495 RepID=A0A8H5PKV3_9HYPO|nr:hypothetical protein FPANT_3895 [Fusarium pseudoanthophilum]
MNLIRSPRNKRHKQTIRLNDNLLIQLPLLHQRPRTAISTRTTPKLLSRPHNPLRPHSDTSLGISSTANTIRYTQTRHGPAPIPRETGRQHESLAGREGSDAAVGRAEEWVLAYELHVGRRLFEAHDYIVVGQHGRVGLDVSEDDFRRHAARNRDGDEYLMLRPHGLQQYSLGQPVI